MWGLGMKVTSHRLSQTHQRKMWDICNKQMFYYHRLSMTCCGMRAGLQSVSTLAEGFSHSLLNSDCKTQAYMVFQLPSFGPSRIYKVTWYPDVFICSPVYSILERITAVPCSFLTGSLLLGDHAHLNTFTHGSGWIYPHFLLRPEAGKDPAVKFSYSKENVLWTDPLNPLPDGPLASPLPDSPRSDWT
jgi:hypothetical protein